MQTRWRDAMRFEMILAICKSPKTGQAVKLPLDDFASEDMTGEF
ncbi:MAG: hypothetical protein RSA17_01870 [Ruthenibacterium sp.]